MIEPGEHISIFGISGCGKSTLTRQASQIFARKIIFDRMAEWSDVENGETVHDFSAFRDCFERTHLLERFTIVVRPEAGSSQDDLLELVNQCLSLIYQVEAFDRKGIALIFEEVWLYAPLHSIPPWFLETLLTGRHHRISIIGNAQRPATVSKTLVSQSRHVFIGQFFEASDKKYYRETLGDLPCLETPPPKFQFIWFRHDQPAQLVSV